MIEEDAVRDGHGRGQDVGEREERGAGIKQPRVVVGRQVLLNRPPGGAGADGVVHVAVLIDDVLLDHHQRFGTGGRVARDPEGGERRFGHHPTRTDLPGQVQERSGQVTRRDIGDLAEDVGGRAGALTEAGAARIAELVDQVVVPLAGDERRVRAAGGRIVQDGDAGDGPVDDHRFDPYLEGHRPAVDRGGCRPLGERTVGIVQQHEPTGHRARVPGDLGRCVAVGVGRRPEARLLRAADVGGLVGSRDHRPVNGVVDHGEGHRPAAVTGIGGHGRQVVGAQLELLDQPLPYATSLSGLGGHRAEVTGDIGAVGGDYQRVVGLQPADLHADLASGDQGGAGGHRGHLNLAGGQSRGVHGERISLDHAGPVADEGDLGRCTRGRTRAGRSRIAR